MKPSIQQTELAEQLAESVNQFVKEKIERIMREEISNFLRHEQEDTSNTRNGYYGRTLDTRYGKIDDLRVPRDRQGEFQTQVEAINDFKRFVSTRMVNRNILFI